MKYAIRRNSMAKHGYELVVISDSGEEMARPLTRKTTDNFLWMPPDVVEATGRKYISLAMLNNIEDGYYPIEPKATTSHSSKPTQGGSSKWSILEFLSEEDQEVFKALVEKAQTAHRIAMARKAVLEAQAQLAALEAQAAGGGQA